MTFLCGVTWRGVAWRQSCQTQALVRLRQGEVAHSCHLTMRCQPTNHQLILAEMKGCQVRDCIMGE